MKILIISLRTTGLMKELFEEHCMTFAEMADVYVITNDNIQKESLGRVKDVLQLRFKRNEPWSYFSLSKIRKARRFIEETSPDILFFYTPHPDNIFLFKTSKKYHMVAQIHNPLPHSGTSRSERLIAGIQKRNYFKYCDAVFVCGERLKADIIDNFSYPADRVYPIKFGALSNWPVINEAIEEKYDAIFFGRIEYYKGIDVLLDATKYIGKRISLVIAGKGEPYFDVNACNANVTFLNEYVDDASLVRLIKASKMVIMPYRDATGTSTVIQAFLYGKPVVGTDVGVFKEYIGDAGIVVPPNDAKSLGNAIATLLEDDAKRLEMGAIGEKYISTRFKLETVCKEYLKVFDTIIR